MPTSPAPPHRWGHADIMTYYSTQLRNTWTMNLEHQSLIADHIKFKPPPTAYQLSTFLEAAWFTRRHEVTCYNLRINNRTLFLIIRSHQQGCGTAIEYKALSVKHMCMELKYFKLTINASQISSCLPSLWQTHHKVLLPRDLMLHGRVHFSVTY